MDVYPTSQFTLPRYPTRPLFTIPGPADVWVRGEDFEGEVEENVEGKFKAKFEENGIRLTGRHSSFRFKIIMSDQD